MVPVRAIAPVSSAPLPISVVSLCLEVHVSPGFTDFSGKEPNISLYLVKLFFIPLNIGFEKCGVSTMAIERTFPMGVIVILVRLPKNSFRALVITVSLNPGEVGSIFTLHESNVLVNVYWFSSALSTFIAIMEERVVWISISCPIALVAVSVVLFVLYFKCSPGVM